MQKDVFESIVAGMMGRDYDTDLTRPDITGEYRVYVDYDGLRNVLSKAWLEAEFPGCDVHSDIYDSKAWELNSLCPKINQERGERVMRLKDFGGRVRNRDAIRMMLKEGYRPATHLEACAFVKAHPELHRHYRIVALGSYVRWGENDFVIASFDCNGDRRSFDHSWHNCRFVYVSDCYLTTFLFVRRS